MQEFSGNDKQTLQIRGFTPSVVDQAGFNFKNADGSDVTPDQIPVSWKSNDEAIAGVSVVDGGIDVSSTAPGHAILSASMAYPDGSTKVSEYGVTWGFSAPGEPSFTSSIVDEPEAPAPPADGSIAEGSPTG
jgi:hypothetical protein